MPFLAPASKSTFYGALQFCPRILDEESAKSGPSSLGGLGGRSECFLRQNSTAEPLFSYSATPHRIAIFSFCAIIKVSVSGPVAGITRRNHHEEGSFRYLSEFLRRYRFRLHHPRPDDAGRNAAGVCHPGAAG